MWDTAFEDVPEGRIFEGLDLKTVGPEQLSSAALGGIQIQDTDDWYAEALKLYPETDESIENRYDLVKDYYCGLPIQKGKKICVIVVTHAAFNFNLPRRMNAKEESALGLVYCASFQA